MNKLRKNITEKSPWAWIPSLYLAQGIPYIAVMTISVIMYKRLGISNTDIALYTSWLYLPWVIKPFWSPFIDLLKTKRWWIVSMQFLIGAGMAGIAFTIPLPLFFQATLAFFWLMAFSSATHDIAADGFYMLALNSNNQAKFVGIRSTFYRVATIMGQGLLIILAGFLEGVTGMEPLNFTVEVNPNVSAEHRFTSLEAKYKEDQKQTFITEASSFHLNPQKISNEEFKLVIQEAERLNALNGFIQQTATQIEKAKSNNVSTEKKTRKLDEWIRDNFGEKRSIETSQDDLSGNLCIIPVRLNSKPEKELILNTTLNKGDISLNLIHGARLVFNESNWDKTAYMVVQADTKLSGATKASFKGTSGNIPLAWSLTFFVLAGLFIAFAIYHKFALPTPSVDAESSSLNAKEILQEFFETFASFFKKPQAFAAIFFMLTFRFSEAQLVKLINPFLIDSVSVGGLGLTTGQVGFVYGTIGIIGLTIGGIVGGYTAAKGGLKKWLWPMALSVFIPSAVFIYLAYSQTSNMFLINLSVFFEQLGYGFGFTAYMLYLMYYAEGKHKTAHYAIATGFMALGMMLPGMFAGWLQELLGYKHFFVWVIGCSIIPIIAVSLLKIDPDYGKAITKHTKQ